MRDAKLEDKNERLHEAVNAIAERNPALRGIINSVRWNEPAPDGSGNKRLDPAIVSGAINYLDPILLDNSNVSPDVLGDVYEYLIKKFADENKAGATAGQFYTPPEVRDIIIRFIQPQPDSTFYDPTVGSGGFPIDGAKFVKDQCGDARRIRLFGQETIWNTWARVRASVYHTPLHPIAMPNSPMRHRFSAAILQTRRQNLRPQILWTASRKS